MNSERKKFGEISNTATCESSRAFLDLHLPIRTNLDSHVGPNVHETLAFQWPSAVRAGPSTIRPRERNLERFSCDPFVNVLFAHSTDERSGCNSSDRQ